MLPGLTLPVSLRRLLDAFAGGFTKPTFVVFTAMVVGMIAQTGSKTVCGMLAGAGLAQTWSHDRVHRFFARAVWSIDAMGMAVLDLVVTHLMDTDAVIVLAVDDTAHRRRGKKVHGASWIHDGSAPSRNKLAFGHRWVLAGVVVHLPFMTRPACLPVACRRWQGKGTASTVELACRVVATIAARLPGRRIHVVADAAYHGKQVRGLPERVTWTTRLPRNATLYRRAPQRTGKRGRPRLKGDKLGKPAQVAADLGWPAVSVARYGRVETVHAAVVDCLWYGAFGPLPVRMVCVRDRDDLKAPMLALVTTDLTSSVADLVARYAMRWAIEVTFFDCRQTLASARPATGFPKRWNAPGRSACTSTASWSSGTPAKATSPRSSPSVACQRRGTCPKPTRRSPTCSPPCYAPSSPLVLWVLAQPNPPTRKSVRSSKHGHSRPHNLESRVVGEPLARLGGDRDEAFAVRADPGRVGSGVDDRVGIVFEGVQVRVVPAHGRLDHLMYSVERCVGRHRDASPHRWFDVIKLDLQYERRRIGWLDGEEPGRRSISCTCGPSRTSRARCAAAARVCPGRRRRESCCSPAGSAGWPDPCPRARRRPADRSHRGAPRTPGCRVGW